MSLGYTVIILDEVEEFIYSTPQKDRIKIVAARYKVEHGDFQAVNIRTLFSPIRELKVGKYRLVFFIQGEIVYFIHAFIKKNKKTPKKEIKYAIKILKIIKGN